MGILDKVLGGGSSTSSMTQNTESTNSSTATSGVNAFDVSGGLFNTQYDAAGNLTQGMDPRLTGIQDQGLGNAADFFSKVGTNTQADTAGVLGQNFLNQLGATGSSAQDIMMQQFGMMNPLLQKQQEQDFLAMEGRLNAQGRLDQSGAGSGAAQMQGLFDSQSDATTKLLYDSLQQGMGYQNHLAGLGSQMSQLDPQLRGMFNTLGNQSLEAPMNFQQQGLNQAGVGGILAGNTSNTSGQSSSSITGTNTTPGTSPWESLGAGFLNAGAGYLTGGLSNMFQPGGGGGAEDGSFSGWGGFDAWMGG